MNQKYTLWIVGALVIIVLGVILFMQNPTPAPVPAPGSTNTTDTVGTSDAESVTAPAGSTGTTSTATKPIVTTTGFASVSTTTAVVVGTVLPEGAQTVYWFEYGPTASLGISTNSVTIGAGWKTVGAAVYLTGLKPATQYYFRLGAKNAYGTVYGGPYNFITNAK